MRGIIGKSGIRVARDAKQIMESRRSGYAAGGHVKHEDEAEDKKLVKRMMRKHDKGTPVDKLKGGGSAVHGKKPKSRLDKKARRASGGATPPYGHGPETSTRHVEQPQYNVDSEPAPKRASGGSAGKKHSRGHGKTNIIIHAGGGGDSGGNPMQLQQAHQAGMQEGMKAGAMAVMQKIKGGMGGAPGGPPGAPPGAGPGMPPPPPPGAGMAPPMGAPMHAHGGKIEGHKAKLHGKTEKIKVKAHTRRRSGGAV